MNIGKIHRAALLPIAAILGTSLVSVALADPNCAYRIVWPDSSQLDIVNNCQSWTECWTSQTCGSGSMYSNCGEPTSLDQMCFEKINGVRDQVTGRCIDGTVNDGGPTSHTIQFYENPTSCDSTGGGGGVS